ncbi:MAG: chloride channel protein [Intestinibaculum porci]|uniref:chloride channel protein n=1 Tax=Intestinibaculum porci TaxID=2487118 RepID=UPI003F0E6D59
MHEILEYLKETTDTYEHRIHYYIIEGFRWLAISLVVGVVCGVVGSLFAQSVTYVTNLRMAHPWLLYFLPIAGIVTVFIYHSFKVSGKGTNDIIDAAREGEKLPFLLIPAIFIGTVLTHLCGGSAGREGAALQIGGDLANGVGRLFKLNKRQMGIITRIGMAAFFSALFGTPVAAAAFGTMMINVGSISYMVIFPGLIASILACDLSLRLGATAVRFPLHIPAFHSLMSVRVIILSLACAIISVFFIKMLYLGRYLYGRYIKNHYIRIIVGGCLIIALTTLLKTTDYNGAGMNVIAEAMKGHVHPAAFFWKILFTSITLEAGYKGGEVVPSFFIGATFGCLMGKLLGIPAGFGAALGMVGVFGAATNSFLAPVFLAVEVFGGDGILYFALCCIICYIFSGYSGLYSSQRIIYSKLNASRIDASPNTYHTGDRGDLD